MNNNELALLQLRINFIEELLCRDNDFRKPYLEALNLIASLARDQQKENYQEFVLAIKDTITRINAVPVQLNS